MLRLGILASGEGTNAQAIFDKAKTGLLHVEVALVISDKPGAPVLERARKAGVLAACVDSRAYPDRKAHDRAMLRLLRQAGCEAIALAGYMRLLGPEFLAAFSAVLNIHPALLPAFPGLHGIADALAYGVKLAGPTVHFVEEKVDSGPIIIQAACPVEDADRLPEAIHTLEHRIYPQALEWLAQGRLKISGRNVELEKRDKPLAQPLAHVLVWPPLEEGF